MILKFNRENLWEWIFSKRYLNTIAIILKIESILLLANESPEGFINLLPPIEFFYSTIKFCWMWEGFSKINKQKR